MNKRFTLFGCLRSTTIATVRMHHDGTCSNRLLIKLKTCSYSNCLTDRKVLGTKTSNHAETAVD